MGAGASTDGLEKKLTKEEAKDFAGELWDEAKWESIEKDEQGRVKLEKILSLANSSVPTEASSTETKMAVGAPTPTGVEMPAETPKPEKKHISMRDRHKYRFPEFHEDHKSDLKDIKVVDVSSIVEVTGDGAESGVAATLSGDEIQAPSIISKAELVFFKLAQKIAVDADTSASSTGFGTRYRPVNINYYKMFKEMNLDGNGRLDKKEFKVTLRKVLQISREDISDQELDDVFVAMDEDGNGSVSLREFAAFERGAQPASQYRGEMLYHQNDSSADVGKSVDANDAEKLMYHQKSDRPEELVSVPQLSDVSTINGSLAQQRVEHAPVELDEAHLVLWHLAQYIDAKTDKEQTGGMVYHANHKTFGRMFKTLDIDENGSITRDEWAITLRKHIGIGTNITDDHLNIMFDAMDFDNSGGVTLREFANWARGASSAANARGLAQCVQYTSEKLEELAKAQEKNLKSI